MFYNIEICVFFFIFLKNTLFCHLRITNILHNSAIRIYLFELKRVRRITLFLGNELATVPIAVVCIALLVRITLTDAKLLQKSEMRKDIVIELSYKGFS